MNIKITARAQANIAGAHKHYEEQRKGLGDEFMLSLEAELSAIDRNPNLPPDIRNYYKRTMMPRFPYHVFYRLDGLKIVIVAVWHFKRKPWGFMKKS